MRVMLDPGAYLPERAHGLMPEEVPTAVEMSQIYSIIEENKRFRALNVTVDRMRELAEADREGRVVVLPVVPVGRPGSSKLLYVIEDGEIYEDELLSATVGVGPSGGVDVLYETFSEQLCFYQTGIGKTVFLTREEAEEALKGRAEND